MEIPCCQKMVDILNLELNLFEVYKVTVTTVTLIYLFFFIKKYFYCWKIFHNNSQYPAIKQRI